MLDWNIRLSNKYGKELNDRLLKHETEMFDILEFIAIRKKEGMPYSDLELQVGKLKDKIEHCTNEFLGYHTKEKIKLN